MSSLFAQIIQTKYHKNSKYWDILNTYCVLKLEQFEFTIGIKHGFPCINVCQVPREMLKTEAVGRGFQHLPRDLANVNVLENNV